MSKQSKPADAADAANANLYHNKIDRHNHEPLSWQVTTKPFAELESFPSTRFIRSLAVMADSERDGFVPLGII